MNSNQSRSSQSAVGLAGRYVICPKIYARETERIFSRSWICVARVEQLDSASQMLPIEVEGHKLFLVCGEDGQIRAFRNFCRHRGSQLVTEENCSQLKSRIQCPYHQWTYARDGALVAAPNMNDVPNFCEEENSLISVPCETMGGFVWICFQPQGSLAEFLSPLAAQFKTWSLDELRLGHEIQYSVKANWKLIFENYSECYHCAAVHPMLNQLTPYQNSTNDIEEGAILGGPMQLSAESKTMSMTGQSIGPTLPGLSESESRSVHYYTICPTMFFSAHPDYVLIHLIERKGAEETKVTCQFLFHPSGSSGSIAPEPAIEFWDLTNRQDWKVCELAQSGMSDPGYIPGPLSNLESVVAAFDRHYLSLLGDND